MARGAVGKKGIQDDARQCFARGIPSSSDLEERAASLFDEGCELSLTGDFIRSVGAFREAAALVPDALTFCNLGVAHEHLGEFDAAISCYSRACKLEPGDPIPRVNLGDALVRQSRYVEASHAYVEALRAKQPLEEAWTCLNNLGVAYERTADPMKAEACYKKAVELRPQYDLARQNYLRMVNQRNAADAATLAERESECQPDPVDAVTLRQENELEPMQSVTPGDDDDDFDASQIARASHGKHIPCTTCACTSSISTFAIMPKLPWW